MATGRLGTPIKVGTTNTTLYTVPSGYYSVFNVSLTNTSSSAATITLYLAQTAASPLATEAIEQQTTIVGYGVFERTGLVLQAGYSVVATSATGGVINGVIYGIETSTS
jgi:hypothetical protein